MKLEEPQPLLPFSPQPPGTRSSLKALLSVLAFPHFLDKLLWFFSSLSLAGTSGLAALSLHLPQLELYTI